MSSITALLCHKCGREAIAAPPGSTRKTRYTCRECTRKIAPRVQEHLESEYVSGQALGWWPIRLGRGAKEILEETT